MNTLAIERSSGTADHRRVRSITAELAVITSVFLLYRTGRLFTRDADGDAMRNARHVIDFERALGIFSEKTVQGWALGSHSLVEFFNQYYVLVHFPVTVGFLIWAYFRHHTAYRLIRTWFVVVTLSALVIHVGFPLAPPRMTNGFVDTLQRYGPRIYSKDPQRSVANQFAAMPSLHFGWACMVAVSFVAIKRTRRSALLFVHPFMTLLAIVATGNHYWLDAIVAALLVAAVGVALLTVRLLRTGRGAPVGPAAEWLPDPEDETTDDPRSVSARNRDRCRQHTPGGHERIELDEISASGAAASQYEHPPG